MAPLSPILRATYQACILSGVSNILAQAFQSHRAHEQLTLDPFELARFVLVTLVTCPPNFHWQLWLERTFPAYYPSPLPPDIPLHALDEKSVLGEKSKGTVLDENRWAEETRKTRLHVGDEASRAVSGAGSKARRNWANVFKKMFVDCITVGTVVNTVAFLALMAILKGQSWHKLADTVKKETFPVILSGYKLWPMVSFFSFSFVPVERRVVFFSAFGLGWNIYMSLVAAAV